MAISTEIVETISSSTTYAHHKYKYDVFLSFRGIDTRLSFTNHLHTTLVNANLSTFLDDEEIETGRDLKPELDDAIKASRASIIVLSKNYASSTWCLEELTLILEQHQNSKHFVLPVFYHVEPTHVRKQQSTFGDAMAKHKQRMEDETNVEKKCQLARKIELWNMALRKVAELKGKDASNRKETEFIQEIVQDIYHILGVPLRTTLPVLIGAEYNIRFITSWLKDRSLDTAVILTILGIGGIGKTSLAKYVYGLYSHNFDRFSFVEDISRRCVQPNGLLDVQKQLCDDISQISLIQIHNASAYTSRIGSALANKKVFLVLDDVDSLDQLDSLLGHNGFHPESTIIITTKDGSLTDRWVLFTPQVQPKHKQVLLEGLSGIQALKLLCNHAFKCQKPKEGYEEVSKMLVKYCEGHPLALKVLGESLRNRTVDEWKYNIDRLKKEPHSRIRKALQISFDNLPFEDDKELFKHIACFFVGKDKDLTETILEACDIHTRPGIKNLTDRCLLSIGWNNELVMHQLIQEMGRYLVRQESPEKPWERSRLWCHEESFKVLKQKMDKGNLVGLALDMRMLDKRKLRGSFELKRNCLSTMENLMLLQLNYVQIHGFFENIPEELRWLCLHGFPLNSIPSDLALEYLVVLDMSYSSIKSFGMCYSNPQLLESRPKELTESSSVLLVSLKILDLSFCEQLLSLGGFFELRALEKLIVKNCIGLRVVCESIEQCVELALVDFSYCHKIENLLVLIGKLKNVKTLLLDSFTSVESQIGMRNINSMDIGITAQTSSSSIMEVIPRNLKSLATYLPCSLVSLSLKDNNMSNESFPDDFSSLSFLKKLYLDGNPIASMPNCVRSLPVLEELSMYNCKVLVSVEHPPRTLRKLSINSLYNPYKSLLRKVVFDLEMSPLIYEGHNLYHSPHSSIQIDGMIKIQGVADVEKKILHSLCWTNLEFLEKRRVETYEITGVPKGSEAQIYYEFGIFSTIYGGEVMPNWIRRRDKGSTISFTIPSSPKKLRGLNFCCVEMLLFSHLTSHWLPVIKVSNITKGHTWKYNHYILYVSVGGRCLTYLSHWMFGMNEMESGDRVTISVSETEWHSKCQVTRECGVTVVYDDGNTEEKKEEEDVLGYYKSWNHIIDGDLSYFQNKRTGEYILKNRQEVGHHIENFKAFSKKKSLTC